MKVNNIKLTLPEFQTLLTTRASNLANIINMQKTYNRMTPEQKEKTQNGPFSIDSERWRSVYSVTHPGTVQEIIEEYRSLSEDYVVAVEEAFKSMQVRID